MGILLAQLGLAAPDVLACGARTWRDDPERDLASVLLDQCGIDQETGDSLRRLLALHLKRHQDDPNRSLSNLGGSEQVLRTFSGELQWNTVTPSSSLHSEVTVPEDHDEQTVIMPQGASIDPGAGAEPVLVRETPGRYRIKSEYGRGGMGRILLAFDKSVGRDVALKELISPDGSVRNAGASPRQGSREATRFLREARITGQLEHPGIVPVYEIALRENESVYYTMKLVRGKTMAEVLRGCATPTERFELLSRFQVVCDAMAYAHDRGVIHRDLKPDNILIGTYGETVVLDWGLARVLDASETADEAVPLTQAESPGNNVERTAAGTIMGTPVYMSPEQCRGDVHAIDPRSDVWALGCILYEILTGRPPFRRDSVHAVLQSIMRESVQPVRELEPAAPPALAKIAERCLEKEQTDRFQNAGQVAKQLHDVIQERQLSAFRESAHQREIAQLARPFGGMLLAVGVFGALGIFLSFLLRGPGMAYDSPLIRFLLWMPIILGVGGYVLHTFRMLNLPPGFITGPTIGIWSAILAGSVGVEVIAAIAKLPFYRLIGVHAILVGVGIAAFAFRVQRWFLVVAGLFYIAGIVMTLYPAQSREILGVVLLLGIGGCGLSMRRWSFR